MIGHNSGISAYEEQKIKNDLTFKLLIRSHILTNALADARFDRSHRLLLSAISRTIRLADGGAATLNRNDLCDAIGVTKATLRNKLYDLRRWGYIMSPEVPNGHSSDEFVFGDSAIDHGRVLSEWLYLEAAISDFCNQKKATEPSLPAVTTVTAGDDTITARSDTITEGSDRPSPYTEKPSLPTVTVGAKPAQKSDPSLYTKKEEEEKKEEREVAKATSASRLAPNDLLNEVAPPPAVVVKRFADRITFKPYDAKRAQVVSLEWLKKTSPPKISDSDLLDYTEYVIHMLYSGALPLTLKSGEERNVFNHFAGSFRIYDSKQTFTLFEQWRRGRQTEATTRAKRQRFEIEEEDIGEMPFDPRAV